MSEKGDKLGKDLRFGFDGLGADLVSTSHGDLDTVSAEDNLVQAIIDRLTTEEGELYELGHADYGSRLHTLIGEINNEATREKIKALVLECLAQEPRISEVARVEAKRSLYDPHRVDVEITVLPIESSVFVTLVYTFRLEA